ncbi:MULTISPECIES: iron ABC transporter permease [unclassified Rhizobium]|uniref:ABC transporter permease n=1 Tax=unclassified Rhizobium TaxID=2613769 RepID=UPI001AE5537A|nr:MULTISPECIES: iron ABC transporter permease [unclassified Rhizobium]MBP2462206.1 iron(III) transport system permease protein [Rhizobium sp. PvP014]MBP2529601.1 iron(III) transport system permease protein [Rhizobium sp. PvP099]
MTFTTESMVASRPRRKPAGKPLAGSSWTLAIAVAIAALTLTPLGFVFWATVATGWETAAQLIFRSRVSDLLFNTVALIVFTVPVATVLATALAWLTERTDLPGAKLWAWLAIVPLAIPAFVQSYAWIGMWPRLNGLGAGVAISVVTYFPFVYLPVSAALRLIDPALEDQAASLGLSPAAVLRRVVLPQLRLSLCGGALLISLHLLSEYGLYAMIRFDTFTTAILDQFQSTYNGVAAHMLALVLVACCFVLIGVDAAVRGRRRYARIGSGVARHPVRASLGVWRYPCLLLPVVTTAVSLGVPVLTLGRWLIAGGADIWQFSEIGLALSQTLTICVIGGVATAAAAVPIAWLSVRRPTRSSRFLEGCYYLASSMPGVVVALALVTISIRVMLPLYQTVATIVIAYVIMFLPRALVSLRASIAQVPAELEQAAESLGRSPARALWSTTVRLAAPGAASAMALSSLGIMNELTATQMLAPNGTRTLAMAFWALTSEIDYAGAAPYALLMILFSLPLTLLLHHQSKKIAGR